MLDSFDFWKFIAGLGIFLFGIYTMEDSVKGMAGRTFKKMVGRYTQTRSSAIGSGIVTTSILQSSSAISMMALAFVGAGIMSLENAIGVIIGSNIGTTVTAWVVAFFGFKISIESFALPLIGIGGISLIFTSSGTRYYYFGRLLLGFGLLFHGLGFMKESVEALAGGVDLAALSDFGNAVFVLAGLVLTALMQSSSATIAIVLTAINSAVITFDSGAAMVIGANVGTTVTVLIGAVGGVPIKKRLALSHLIFNFVTGLAALLLLPVITWLIATGVGWQEQPVLGIALFHTLFNVLGMLLFLPFIPTLAPGLNKMYPEPMRLDSFFIRNTSPDITEAALTAFKKEILHQYIESRDYLVDRFSLDREGLPDGLMLLLPEFKEHGRRVILYENIKKLHGEIFEYYAKIQAYQLSEGDSKELDLYLRASRSIMNATKNLRSVHNDLVEFDNSENDFLNLQSGFFNRRLETLLMDLDSLLKKVIYIRDTGNSFIQAFLDSVFQKVEEEDTGFITRCSEAISGGRLTDLQVTSLLMTNRLFTQSCRMIVLSLEVVLISDAAMNGLEKHGEAMEHGID